MIFNEKFDKFQQIYLNIYYSLCDGMVDVPVLGTGVLWRVGSSPTKGKQRGIR